MKTQNAKWMRRISGLLATLMLVMSFAGQASAIILFQDDATHDIDSEGITINADDAGDEDVTLQFGNDGTDATITFDDGLNDLIFTGAGLDFSGSEMFRIREDSDPASNAVCSFVGELIYDTGSNELQICTATGTAGSATWAAVSSGGDANTLDTLDSTQFLRSDTSDNFTSGTLTLDSGTTLTVNGIATIGDGGDTVAINSSDWDISATGDMTGIGGVTMDGSFSQTGTGTFGTGTGAVSLNGATTVANGSSFTANGQVTLGDNGDTVTINSSDWDISATGDMTGIGAITADGLITGTAGATVSGAAVSLNNNSNFAVNVGTGTSTGAVSIGGGANTVAINTTTWDISSAGVGSGFTGFTSTGVVDYSGASRLALHSGGTTPTPCTEGDIFYNTGDNTTYICTVTGNPGTWSALSFGSQDFESVYSADTGKDLLVTDNTATAFTIGEGANDYITIVTTDGSEAVQIDQTLTVNQALNANGAVTLGDNGDTVTINSSDWDISATGDMTGIGAITADGLITGTAGTTISGAASSINANSNFTTDINTGTSTGAVSIGGGANTVAINTTTWDISSAGVGSGFTGLTSTGTVNFSGASSYRMREVADEATANCTTVNEVVLDTTEDKIYVCTATGTPGTWTSAADKVDTMVFEPEYPNYVLWGDGSDNKGKMEALYDSTNGEQYYRWTTGKNVTHDYDVRFRYTLPDDYNSAGNMTLRFRNDSITLETDNWVNVTVRNDTNNAICHADGEVQATVADTWETLTITGSEIETGCTGASALDPGDVIEVIIKMGADNVPNSGGTDVGTLSFAYTN